MHRKGGATGGGPPPPDPVVAIIKSKVLQEFIPQVPDIVTYIEKHYGYNTATASDFLLNKVGNVLAALSTPLLDEERKRQRRVDTLDEELAYVRDRERKAAGEISKAAGEITLLKQQNDRHRQNLMALMRAFDLPRGVNVADTYAKLKDAVDKVLEERREYDTVKRQHEQLENKLKEKADRLEVVTGERIAGLSNDLLAIRTEMAEYRNKTDSKIAALKRSVKEKDESIKLFKAANVDALARIRKLATKDKEKTSRIEKLIEKDVEKQARIDELNEKVASQQSSVVRLTAARDAEFARINETRDECTVAINRYASQIESLNGDINVLRAKLSESAKIDAETKTRLVEYDAIKNLYERVSGSLEKARAHYAAAGMDYNEPVTNIILDVLTKVQTYSSDFVTIPRPAPASPVDVAEIPPLPPPPAVVVVTESGTRITSPATTVDGSAAAANIINQDTFKLPIGLPPAKRKKRALEVVDGDDSLPAPRRRRTDTTDVNTDELFHKLFESNFDMVKDFVDRRRAAASPQSVTPTDTSTTAINAVADNNNDVIMKALDIVFPDTLPTITAADSPAPPSPPQSSSMPLLFDNNDLMINTPSPVDNNDDAAMMNVLDGMFTDTLPVTAAVSLAPPSPPQQSSSSSSMPLLFDSNELMTMINTPSTGDEVISQSLRAQFTDDEIDAAAAEKEDMMGPFSEYTLNEDVYPTQTLLDSITRDALGEHEW